MPLDSQDVSLRELSPASTAGGRRQLQLHCDAVQPRLDQASSRRWEARKRVLVLMGSAIAQLPIWGNHPPSLIPREHMVNTEI